ncbi:hypothetical protein [Gracilibacillus xinjiangensis]|uniref:RNA polymerase subunit sigma n=1 Tax=Gracilibacillus xinjiangensis TaxID=1193282 RepID=A0ABV8WZK5_9BACI
MSWKAVEMQVALPRTQDAGKLQDLLQQQGRLAQEQLVQTLTTEEMRKRQRIEGQQASEKMKNNKEEKNLSQSIEENGIGNESITGNDEIQHPYLGKQVDFSG